jgi:hypothetical protein
MKLGKTDVFSLQKLENWSKLSHILINLIETVSINFFLIVIELFSALKITLFNVSNQSNEQSNQ